MKKFKVLLLALLVSSLGISTGNADIRVVDEAPIYQTPEGASNAVITQNGRIIGDYFGWGDDTAFAIVDGVADDANEDENDVGFDLGFEINFFGRTYDKIFLNTNGFITFDGATTNYGLNLKNLIASVCADTFDDVCPEGGVTGIAAFSPDLYAEGDTGGETRGVYFGQTTLENGNKAYVITYNQISECCTSRAGDPEGSFFQIVVESLGNGDFQVMFNYDYISEVTGNAWTVTREEEWGGVARPVAGFGVVRAVDADKDVWDDVDYTTDAEIYELFLDKTMAEITSTLENRTAGTALSVLSQNSSIPGRFILFMKGGAASTEETGKDRAFWQAVEGCRLGMASILGAGKDVSTSTYQSCFFTGVNSSNTAAVNAALKDVVAKAAASGAAISHADLMKAAAQIADRLDLIERLANKKLVYAAEFEAVGINLGAYPTKTLDALKALPSADVDTLDELLAQIKKVA